MTRPRHASDVLSASAIASAITHKLHTQTYAQRNRHEFARSTNRISISRIASALAHRMSSRGNDFSSGPARRLSASHETRNRDSTSMLVSALASRLSSQKYRSSSDTPPRGTSDSDIRNRRLLDSLVASAISRQLTAPARNSLDTLASSSTRLLASSSAQRVFTNRLAKGLASAVAARLTKPTDDDTDVIDKLSRVVVEQMTSSKTSLTDGDLPINEESMKPD